MLNDVTAGRNAAILLAGVTDTTGNTGVSYQLFDETDQLITSGSVSSQDVTTYSITVKIAASHLTLNKISAGRKLAVTINLPAGAVVIEDYFVLKAEIPLAPMVNSFATYTELIGIEPTLAPILANWGASGHDKRQSALTHAYHSLIRLPYRINLPNAINYPGYDDASFGQLNGNQRRIILSRLSAEEFEQLPVAFTTALKRAQVLEAESLLDTFSPHRRRVDGVLSETIGESSIMFQSGKALELPVSKAAMREISRYVILSVGAGRA